MQTLYLLGHRTELQPGPPGPCTAALQAVTATPCFKAFSSA